MCKCVNGNLCILHDFYYPLFDSLSKTPLHRYEFALLHAALCMLRDCFRGSTFPYQVVHWLATKLLSLEYVVLGNVFHNGTWLLHEDDNHWTTLEMNKIVLQDRDHFDSLLTYISVDRSSLSTKLWSSQKRPHDKLKIISRKRQCYDECFTFVDCAISSRSARYMSEVEWCHQDLLKSLVYMSVVDECHDQDDIKTIRKVKLYDVMPHVPHEFKFMSYSAEPKDMSSVC